MVYGSVDHASDHIAHSHSYEVYESLDHASDLTFTRPFTVYELLNHGSDIFLAQYKYVYGKKKGISQPIILVSKVLCEFQLRLLTTYTFRWWCHCFVIVTVFVKVTLSYQIVSVRERIHTVIQYIPFIIVR